jgi:hypothetical protein
MRLSLRREVRTLKPAYGPLRRVLSYFAIFRPASGVSEPEPQWRLVRTSRENGMNSMPQANRIWSAPRRTTSKLLGAPGKTTYANS